MSAYFKAVLRHVGTATFDTIFVAVVGLAPLLVGRLASLVTDGLPDGAYWRFLTNGQLAFYSMSSLATLLLVCLSKKLPDKATKLIGFFAIGCALFLVALVAADPTLQRGQAFFGASALYLYLGVLIIRISADAMKAVGPGDALEAGADLATKVRNELAERMGKNA